jgi:hypothetical protein
MLLVCHIARVSYYQRWSQFLVSTTCSGEIKPLENPLASERLPKACLEAGPLVDVLWQSRWNIIRFTDSIIHRYHVCACGLSDLFVSSRM